MEEPAEHTTEKEQAKQEAVSAEERRGIGHGHGSTTKARTPGTTMPQVQPSRNTGTSVHGEASTYESASISHAPLDEVQPR